MDFAQVLEMCADRVEKATHTLNRNHENCKACGLDKKENFEEFKMAEELEGVVNKLRRFAEAQRQREQKRGGA